MNKMHMILIVTFVASGLHYGAEPLSEVRFQEKPGQSIALVYHKTVQWQFNYGPGDSKPYFHPLALPDGTVLTADAPDDHPWHKGHWFSWKFINGENYWEFDRSTGKSQGATEWSDVKIKTRKDFSARITLALKYRSSKGVVVMTEKRTIDISAPDEAGRFHLDWTCRFQAVGQDVTLDRTPLPNEPGGKAWGGYAGLSMRMSKQLGRRLATTNDGPIKFNDQQRYRGKHLAMDYSGVIKGTTIGAALCDHPGNLNHPSPWYVIRSEPMSFYMPAVICYQPHTIKAGQSLTLRYRVILHPGRWDAKTITSEYQKYIKEYPKPKAVK